MICVQASALHDLATLELALHFMQLLCEGHNADLQNYLRAQPDHIKSIDLVTLCVELLHVMIQEVDKHTVDVLIQACDWCFSSMTDSAAALGDTGGVCAGLCAEPAGHFRRAGDR